MSLRLIDQITGFCKASNDVLDRHMATFGKQDMTGLMTDYAPDAVMFTPNGLVRGTEALRKGLEQLFAEWGKPGVKFTLKQRIVDGKNAYIFWDAETADNLYEGAVDAFVEEGKIVAHFFSGKTTPKIQERSRKARTERSEQRSASGAA